MEKILLVEPNYKNKYPPIGLMKMSTYFKERGDYVEFHKGLLTVNETEKFDKVYITTLFTFDFKMCMQTIRYYIEIKGIEKVYVGGIAATIMPDKFKKEIPGLKMITGQLTDSGTLGYEDNINIDALSLDYDILYDTPYVYPMEDSYFIHTSRGCPRRCEFCAVKDLEPEFYDCDNIVEQIVSVNNRYGIKKNLLIMDNNILFSSRFNQVIEQLEQLGFGRDNNSARKNNRMRYYLKSLSDRINSGRQYNYVLSRIYKELDELKFSRIKTADEELLREILDQIQGANTFKAIEVLISKRGYLVDFFERYNYHKITRYVDFNQGLDARLFSREKAMQLGRLALKPCRIAFDDLKTRTDYLKAMEMAADNGITHFSNYLLYNYKEYPGDLWTRLYVNIQFCAKHPNVNLFSFPMKYAAINMTDRSYIGQYWNKKYLRAINVILNVTQGVVAKEEDFFYRAFGHSEIEFVEILTMPDDFIRHRAFFEENGLIEQWKRCYKELTFEQKKQLIGVLAEMVENPEKLNETYDASVEKILKFYRMSKASLENKSILFSQRIEKNA